MEAPLPNHRSRDVSLENPSGKCRLAFSVYSDLDFLKRNSLINGRAVSNLAFTTTDCWVLFSIGFGNRGSTIKNIITTGDYLNRDVLSRKDLEISLNKLLYNDYIRISDGKYYATEKALSFYNKYKKPVEGCIAEWLRFVDILKQQPFRPGESKAIIITEKKYRKSFNVFLRLINIRFLYFSRERY